VNRVLIALVDVAAEAREMYGVAAREMYPHMAEHDWRFEVQYRDASTTTGTGNEQADDGRITFNRYATAREIAAYLKSEGIAAPELAGEAGSEATPESSSDLGGDR
jgi:hypothetical protein